MSYRFADSCQQTSMTYKVAVCTVEKTSDDGQRNCPTHVEFHSKNKFEKLVPLVGFIIRTLIIFGLRETTRPKTIYVLQVC